MLYETKLESNQELIKEYEKLLDECKKENFQDLVLQLEKQLKELKEENELLKEIPEEDQEKIILSDSSFCHMEENTETEDEYCEKLKRGIDDAIREKSNELWYEKRKNELESIYKNEMN